MAQFTPKQQAILDRVKQRKTKVTQATQPGGIIPDAEQAQPGGIVPDSVRFSPQQMSGEIPVMPEEMEQLPEVYAPREKQQPQRSLGEKALGALEAGATMATGATTGTAGQLLGTVEGMIQSIREGTYGTQEGVETVAKTAQEYSEMGTYRPRTASGQEQVQAIGKTLEPLAHTAAVAPMVGGMEQALLRQGARAGARQAVNIPRQVVKNVDDYVQKSADSLKASIQRRKNSRFYGQGESAGAAATEKAGERIATAESLPVPVKLTEGAATRNAEQLAFEKEQMKMAMGGPLRDRVEQNNLEILDNFDAMIDRTGAEAVRSGKSDVGRSVIAPLMQGYDSAKAKVKHFYDVANNSPESRIMVKPTTLEMYINKQITGSDSVHIVDAVRKFIDKEKNNLGQTDSAGNVYLGRLDEAGDLFRRLSVRDLETVREFINKHTRRGNGNDEYHAIAMKNLIDEVTMPVAGPLYKKARRMRQRQGELFENRANVARLLNTKKGGSLDPQVALDQVFNKTIISGSPQEIGYMRRLLNSRGPEGKQAWRELQGATVDFIRERATSGMGTDSNGNPLVSTAKLNNVIKQLDNNGRLDVVFGKQQAQVMRDLAEVAKYVDTVPPGTLINNSGTAATLLLAMGEMGTTGFVTGLPVPVVSSLKVIKNYVSDRKIKKRIDRALSYSERITEGEAPKPGARRP